MNEVPQILHVEDDENDVFFFKLAFSNAKINGDIHVARDGQEAIEYLAGHGNFADRNAHPLPCLIIMDLKMPRRTGIDVLRWLQDQPVLRCIPLIVLSSSAHRYDVERAYGLGANAFVSKPSSLEKRDELMRLIRDFWLKTNEPSLLYKEGMESAKAFHEKGDSASFDLLT